MLCFRNGKNTSSSVRDAFVTCFNFRFLFKEFFILLGSEREQNENEECNDVLTLANFETLETIQQSENDVTNATT